MNAKRIYNVIYGRALDQDCESCWAPLRFVAGRIFQRGRAWGEVGRQFSGQARWWQKESAGFQQGGDMREGKGRRLTGPRPLREGVVRSGAPGRGRQLTRSVRTV